jgi:L-rhamnose mutarotase
MKNLLTTTQHVLMLDLQDDSKKINAYEEAHRKVWAEVSAHLKHHGIKAMKIHRLGTRLVMVMETDDSIFNADAFDRAGQEDPVIQRWEQLMWAYQKPTPWTPPGQKWTLARCIFDWNQCSQAEIRD